MMVAGPGRADVASEAKWHPIAAAYLFAMFVTNLEPIDWPAVEDRFAGAPGKFRHGGDRPAYELLAPVGRFAGTDFAGAIRKSIAERDVRKFRRLVTQTASSAVRLYLDRARRTQGSKQAALSALLEARAVYAGLADFVRGRDVAMYRRLGRAWLELTTALGRGGDASKAESGTAVIDEALIRLFEGDDAGTARRREPWLPPDANLTNQDPLPRLVLNFEKHGVDERDLFLVAYGDMLFDSPEIFGEPARSHGITCAMCHNRSDVNQRLYIPGLSLRPGGVDVDGSLFNPRGNDHRFDSLDTPSLRGIRFTAPYGRDGRTASLREFARNVIVGEFAGPEPSPLMLDALVTYMNEFDFLPAPNLDRNGRLVAGASDAAKRGEKLFIRPFAAMGGQSCASCHVPSAHFVDHRRHDIGSGFGVAAAFDTPTLLGIDHNAPYFHDGSLETLAEVVDWFDRKFGLGLSAPSKSDLTAYLEAVGTGTEPYQRFEGRNTPFRLAFEELSTFLSTLDTLIPARDRFHARLLLATVSRDLRTDAAGMSNIREHPRVLELADRLDGIDQALARTDWPETTRLWEAYKETEKRYDAKLY
jgi:cytochrome c peroxidase